MHALHALPPTHPHWPPCAVCDPCLQTLVEWAAIYVRYLQTFRKMECVYDQMVHPQKRLDVKRALEACMGRMLEIRHWMVRAHPSPSPAPGGRLRTHAESLVHSPSWPHTCTNITSPPCRYESAQVKLNRGLDTLQLDELLLDLKATPDTLEVPVPRYFVEDRAAVSHAPGVSPGDAISPPPPCPPPPLSFCIRQ